MRLSVLIPAVLLYLTIRSTNAAPSNVPVPETVKPETVKDATALTVLIKKQLPPGWTVACQSKFPGIELKRLKPTAMDDPGYYFGGYNISVADKLEPLRHFTTFLSVGKFISPANYQRLYAANQKTEKQMNHIATGLLMGKFGYTARNAAEARRVKQYEQLEKSLHDLPDYYWHQVSLWKTEIPGVADYELVQDEKVKKECKQVTLKMLNLLKVYNKPVSLSRVSR